MSSSTPVFSTNLQSSQYALPEYPLAYSSDYSSECPPDALIDAASQSMLLRSLRRSRHLSQQQVSEYLQISRQMYGRFERGRYLMPAELWERLSHFLPVPDFLIIEDTEPCLTETKEEKDLLIAFRQLDAEGKKQVLSLIQFETSWLQNS